MYKVREYEAFRRFYSKLYKANAEQNVVIYYNSVPYSIYAIALEVHAKTKLGKELFKYLQNIGLLRKW